MRDTYICSRSCRCSCFSSELGSRDHTPVRPSHPEGTGEGSTSWQMKAKYDPFFIHKTKSDVFSEFAVTMARQRTLETKLKT